MIPPDDSRSTHPGRPAHFPDGTQLADVDDGLLDALVRNLTLAADQAVLDALRADRDSGTQTIFTEAQRTRIAIRAAIRNGLRNGALAIAPQETWPEWWELDA